MSETTIVLPDIRLRFNIDNPNLEDCYRYGYECAKNEIDESVNPFQINTRESEMWSEGWWAGFYGDEPLFDMSSHTEEAVVESAAANDHIYQDGLDNFFIKLLEISGVLAVSAIVGYQLIELVA